MNHTTKVKAQDAEIIPFARFNALAAYEEERERVRKLRDHLERSLSLLSLECDRRSARGEDVSHVRDFVLRTRREAWA